MTNDELKAIRERDAEDAQTLPMLDAIALTVDDPELRNAIHMVRDRSTLLQHVDHLTALLRNSGDSLSDTIQSDMENGVKWLNENAAAEFKRKYPALNGWIGTFLRRIEEATHASAP